MFINKGFRPLCQGITLTRKSPVFAAGHTNKAFWMNMSFLFWIVTVIMAMIALSFLIFPVVQRQKKLTRTVWVTAIAVPALAIGLYIVLGQPGATDYAPTHTSTRAVKARNPASASGNLGSVQSMLTGLEEKLKSDPSDAKGWLLLAKSYSHLGSADDAAAAYAKASALGQVDLEFEARLEGSGSKAANLPIIRGRLTIADAAKGRLDPDDSIFIFAKSTDGSPLPVAVLRKVVSDLPLEFELTDKLAMSADAKLSNTAAVTITARVSRSGNAMQAEPGLEAVSEPINVGDDVLVELRLGPTQSSDES